MSHQSHTAFTYSEPVRHNRRVGVRACGQLPRKPKQNQIEHKTNDETQSIALATVAASSVAADQVKVFNKKVSGVPAASTEVIADNVISPEFAPDLVVEGMNLLENPSGVITRFGNLSDGSRTEPDENTYLILDRNPGGPDRRLRLWPAFPFSGT